MVHMICSYKAFFSYFYIVLVPPSATHFRLISFHLTFWKQVLPVNRLFTVDAGEPTPDLKCVVGFHSIEEEVGQDDQTQTRAKTICEGDLEDELLRGTHQGDGLVKGK